jgi:hypothetical protein
MRVIRWVALICIVLLLLYGVSPYVSFWRFTVALRSGDTAAINARVDFPAVRESLKKQLVARLSSVAIGHKRLANLGPTWIDVLVDAYATPEGLAILITNPKVMTTLQPPQQASVGKSIDPSKIRYAFFTGPRNFVVDMQEIRLRFRLTGLLWRLNMLDLGPNPLKR